ncbi:MAG: hypothetical protein U1F35_09935 [Steroidobacteraceae bacterium]
MKTMLILTALTLLAACGSSQPAGNAASAATTARASSGNASAAEVAEAARGKVHCPARIETPPRAATAPIDDIVGVRPGMSWEEAANVVLCSDELMVVTLDTSRRFNINTYGQTIRQGFSARFAEPHIQKDSRQIMKEMQDDMLARSGNAVREDMKPGQSKWYVSTMGTPGRERVIAAAREEWFAEGRNPAMQGLEQALVKKYGEPTRVDRNGGHSYLVWSHDPGGQMIAASSPLYHQCIGNSDPDGGTNFSPDCGIVIVAQVFPVRDNPGLSRYFQVGVIDQAGGYAAITGTEKLLGQLDAQRRAQEVAAATQNADTPKL